MQRSRRNLAIPLLLAALVLAVLVIYLGGWPPSLKRAASKLVAGILLPTSTVAPPTARPRPTSTDLPAPTLIPSETPFSLGDSVTTPADEWANAVLDRLLMILAAENPAPPDGLAWWHNQEAQGELAYVSGELLLGERMLDMVDPISLLISTPDPGSPELLIRLGTVTAEQTVITLTALGETPAQDADWVISNAHPLVALKALVLQAARRDRTLIAAYTSLSESALHFVLLDARLPQHPTATLTPLPPGYPTPTATHTPTPTITPTSTRQPDDFMGRLLADKIDPFIDTADRILPDAVLIATQRHPWAGLLTWSETGAQIAGRPLAVEQALELTFYALNTNDPEGSVTQLFYAIYVDGTTRFPDDQVYFQGQRMQEILFWLVRHAAERGGQLLTTYDDFGARQSIIFIGFHRFTASTPAPISLP